MITHAQVRDTVWKNTFLQEIEGLTGFKELAEQSRGNRRTEHCQNDWDEIKQPALEILARYPKRTLIEARHHYNTTHLVEFWKGYCTTIQEYIAKGIISGSFPVFLVHERGTQQNFDIEALSPAYFDHFEYRTLRKLPPACLYKYNAELRERKRSWQKLKENEDLERFICKLRLLEDIYSKTTTYFYNRFINKVQLESLSTWGDYRIHLFLDHFLYLSKDGQTCDAPFEKIFFSSNLSELSTYLRHVFARKRRPPLEKIDEFLGRQRRYYIELAMTLDIVEVTYINNSRHLMHYDRDKRIVVMPPMESGIRTVIEQDLIQAAGVIKMSGCPFAKSKGMAENAVLEVFRHFDLLMLELVRHWYSFLRP